MGDFHFHGDRKLFFSSIIWLILWDTEKYGTLVSIPKTFEKETIFSETTSWITNLIISSSALFKIIKASYHFIDFEERGDDKIYHIVVVTIQWLGQWPEKQEVAVSTTRVPHSFVNLNFSYYLLCIPESANTRASTRIFQVI